MKGNDEQLVYEIFESLELMEMLLDGLDVLFAVLSHFLQKISWFLLSAVMCDSCGYYHKCTSGFLIAVLLNINRRPC